MFCTYEYRKNAAHESFALRARMNGLPLYPDAQRGGGKDAGDESSFCCRKKPNMTGYSGRLASTGSAQAARAADVLRKEVKFS